MDPAKLNSAKVTELMTKAGVLYHVTSKLAVPGTSGDTTTAGRGKRPARLSASLPCPSLRS